jgi:hypothetical protein
MDHSLKKEAVGNGRSETNEGSWHWLIAPDGSPTTGHNTSSATSGWRKYKGPNESNGDNDEYSNDTITFEEDDHDCPILNTFTKA